jgi:hypothetical protein
MNRDRDRIYGTVVTRRLRTMGIRDNAHLLPVPRHGNRNRVLVGERQFKYPFPVLVRLPHDSDAAYPALMKRATSVPALLTPREF